MKQKKVNYKFGDIIEICAVDWAKEGGNGGRLANEPLTPIRDLVVGIVVAHYEGFITVAQEYFSDNCFRNSISIPMVNVHNIRKIGHMDPKWLMEK